MRRILLGLLTGLALINTASVAQDGSTRACDLAAASRYDQTRTAGTPGIVEDKIDPRVALPACQAALATAPENPRLLFQMGRIFDRMKDYDKARPLFEKAAAQGHPSAEVMLGYYHEVGLGGLLKNAQEGARLYKLAADQGNPVGQSISAMIMRRVWEASREMIRRPPGSLG